jgi:hypothetical protein
MSKRANGWLLIFGGLAIGLVLWLSPSQGGSSWNIGSMARRDVDGLIRSVSPRHQTISKSSLMTLLLNLFTCSEDCGSTASE